MREGSGRSIARAFAKDGGARERFGLWECE